MACPVLEVSVKGLRRTHLEQLEFYIQYMEDAELYYGNRKHYEQRHADLKEWVTGVADQFRREDGKIDYE